MKTLPLGILVFPVFLYMELVIKYKRVTFKIFHLQHF